MNQHVPTPVRSFTGAKCAWILPDAICEQLEADIKAAVRGLRRPYRADRAMDAMLLAVCPPNALAEFRRER